MEAELHDEHATGTTVPITERSAEAVRFRVRFRLILD